MGYDKVVKIMIGGVVFAFALKMAFTSGIFNTYSYAGDGYSIKYPVGWTKNKKNIRMGVFVTNVLEKDTIRFEAPGTDPLTQNPEASMTVISAKLTAPSWIDDIWPKIFGAVIRSPVHILDKGEIKIDNQIAKWVLYQTKKKPAQWTLEFYLTDEKDGFYKIRFSGTPGMFKKHRPAFEAAKDTFKFKAGLF